jgi:hypothetical protein
MPKMLLQEMLPNYNIVTKDVTIYILLEMITTIKICYKITSTNIVRNGYIHKIRNQRCIFNKDFDDCLFLKILGIY